MSTRRILITGGLGFIGQALLRSLPANGWQVRILDNLTNQSISVEAARQLGAEVVVGDITDRNVCASATKGCDAVVHLAGQTYVAKSVAEPFVDLEINGVGTLNLLEACRASATGTFVAASSNAIAGAHPPPFNEQALASPLSPYGCSKLLMEAYCHAYAHTHRIRTVALRFSNVYGPGSWRKGSVVASFLRRMLEDKPLTIHGDGLQSRDFLYIDDIVQAINLALEHGPAGSCFCIGSGQRTTILDLATELSRLANRSGRCKVMLSHEPPRVGDTRENWSDIALARRILGFAPTVDLQTGLAQTFDWFVDHGREQQQVERRA